MPKGSDQGCFDWAAGPDGAGTAKPKGTGPMARTLLEMAHSIQREEEAIKRAILEAAEQRDSDRVKDNVSRWLRGPVDEVLSPPSSDTSDGQSRPNRHGRATTQGMEPNERNTREKS